MDFELSKEQAAIQKAAVEFGKKRILPIKKELIAKKEFPRELIQEIGALGFLGGPIPTKYGGTESGFLSQVLIAEEITRVFMEISFIFNNIIN